MKTISRARSLAHLTTALMALLLSTSIGFAQSKTSFEGHIRMDLKMEAGDGMDESMLDAMPIPKGIDYYVKGDKSKVVMASKATGTQEILSIPDKAGKTQTYRLDAVNKVAQRMVMEASKPADVDKSKVVKTTQTKVINGYTCTLYKCEMQEPNSGMNIKQDIWATTEIDYKRPSMGANEAWSEKIQGFPLQIDMDMMIVKLTMQVSKVDKVAQPEAMFVIPKGYKIEDLDTKKALPTKRLQQED